MLMHAVLGRCCVFPSLDAGWRTAAPSVMATGRQFVAFPLRRAFPMALPSCPCNNIFRQETDGIRGRLEGRLGMLTDFTRVGAYS